MTARCGAIILAAGQSKRMGVNKLIAPFAGKPMITHVADAVVAAGLPAIAVLGHAEQAVRDVLAGRKIGFAVAGDFAHGMAHSLAAGIAAIPPEWDAAIICLGDMPLISPDLLRMLAQRASPSAILIPAFDGQRGNPVLWGRDYFAELAELTGDTGARGLFARHQANITTLPWRDDGILRDFDTPEALKRVE